MKRQLILNNHLITYCQAGEGELPIIFLHGWRSEAAIWLPLFKKIATEPSLSADLPAGRQKPSAQARALAKGDTLNPKRYTLYAIDLPGFGASEPPQTPFTLADYANTIKEFIKTLYPIPSTLYPIIVAHSFGARVAIKLAAEHPELVQKLILVGSGGSRSSETKRTLLTALAKMVKPLFVPRFMQPLRRKIYEALGAEDYLATPELKNTYLNIIREPLEPLFPRIHTPTLIMWGEHDAETPIAYGQKIHRAIRDSRFVIIKNAGHFCFIDQPEEFLNLLKSDFNP